MNQQQYEQLLSFGLFSEYLPNNFTTEDLVQNSQTLISIGGFNDHTKPTTFTIHKTDLIRRPMRIPNVRGFFTLVNYMKDNWVEIDKLLNQKSLSKVYYPDNMFDIPTWRESANKTSTFNENKKHYVKESMGCCYALKVDITNCYGSIYTHAIERFQLQHK